MTKIQRDRIVALSKSLVTNAAKNTHSNGDHRLLQKFEILDFRAIVELTENSHHRHLHNWRKDYQGYYRGAREQLDSYHRGHQCADFFVILTAVDLERDDCLRNNFSWIWLLGKMENRWNDIISVSPKMQLTYLECHYSDFHGGVDFRHAIQHNHELLSPL